MGNITGDARPEIVVPTAEFDDNPAAPAPRPAGLGGFGGILNNVLANVLGGSGRVYALDAGGDIPPFLRAGRRIRTASSPMRCLSSGPASTTRWATWTAIPSSR